MAMYVLNARTVDTEPNRNQMRYITHGGGVLFLLLGQGSLYTDTCGNALN